MRRYLALTPWIVVSIVGIFLAGPLNNRLTTSLAIPNSESAKAQQLLTEKFGDNPEGTFTVFYRFRNATPDELAHLKNKIALAVSTIPTAKVIDSRALGGYLYTSVATTGDLAQASRSTDTLRKALKTAGLTGVLVTGPPAIKSDVTPVMDQDLRRGQVVALAIALILLILILGFSWAVLIPLLFALINIATAIGLIYLLSFPFTMVLYIPNIVELIGLGLAIDYSLLVIHRFRTELRNENISVDDALATTMETAGRTIRISGMSVSIGLAILLFIPVPFIRSLGLAGLVVPFISVISTLTFLPLCLRILGRAGIRPYFFSGLLYSRNPLQGFFGKVAQLSVRRPKTVAISSLISLGAIAAAIFSISITPSALTQIPPNLESARGIALVTDQVGNGVITPHQIVIDLGSTARANDADVELARQSLITEISALAGTFAVGSDTTATFVDPTGQFLRLFIAGRDELGTPSADEFSRELRKVLAAHTFPAGTKIYIGGAPAQGEDLMRALRQSFPWILGAALIFTYWVLRRALKSTLLPLKALAMDLISLTATLGALVVMTRSGLAHLLFGAYQYNRFEAWVLVFLIAVLFGLSMDYEVFIVSRIREAWLHGKNNDEAVVEGVAHTGGVVTAAAFILIGAMSGFIWGHFVGLQQLGMGLALGILIDATIVRLFLLPSAMVLLGKWNWQFLLGRDRSAENQSK